MIYGYVRISTKKQEKGFSIEEQIEKILRRYPDAHIITETKQGNRQRPEFEQLLRTVASGDLIVTVDHTRFSRDTAAGLQAARELMDKGVLIHFLSFGLLENTPMGRYVLAILFANAELEVSMITDRTQSGRRRAKKKAGYVDGRPPKYSRAKLKHALALYETHTAREVEELTGISKSTLMRAKRKIESTRQ